LRTYLECIPCFFRQALEAAKKAGADEVTQKDILDRLARMLPDITLDSSPPEMGRIIYNMVSEITGIEDLYSEEKKKSNKMAMGVYDRMVGKLMDAEDSILCAVEMAVAGNIIDYGAKSYLDVDAEIERLLDAEEEHIKKESRRLFDHEKFLEALSGAENILYLGDNAGEIVFDRILIEEIKRSYPGKTVTFAVKEKPIINDALKEDALLCGIGDVAEIVSSGSDAPGTVLPLCSEDFLKRFGNADMVISKGQGNFEALSGVNRPVFFLFMAKCPVISEHAGCSVGDVILRYHDGRNS
jgi:hypothetical protein